MRVVVDTNVFISGVFWKGPPLKVLEAWSLGQFRLILSPEIFAEYQRVMEELGRKFPEIDTGRILNLVGYHAEIVPDLKFTKPICSDPDDDKFLAAAFSAKASYLVTGDKALLKLAELNGTKIVQPTTFLKVIK